MCKEEPGCHQSGAGNCLSVVKAMLAVRLHVSDRRVKAHGWIIVEMNDVWFVMCSVVASSDTTASLYTPGWRAGVLLLYNHTPVCEL